MTSRITVLILATLWLAVCADGGPPRLAVEGEEPGVAYGVREALAGIGGLQLTTAVETATHIIRVETEGDNGELTLDAQLIETGSNKRVWSKAFQSGDSEAFNTENEIARGVAAQLGIRLTADEEKRLGATAPRNPAAVREYRRALGLLDDPDAAIPALRLAIKADTSFVRAYVRLSEIYASLGSDDRHPADDAYRRARSAALQALNLNDNYGPAHTALAVVTSDYLWEWAEAEKFFERALVLSPHQAAAHSGYADLLAKLRRFKEARHHAELARQIDPDSAATRATWARLEYFDGNGDNPFAALDPARHPYLRATAQTDGGNLDEAMRLLSLAVEPRDPLLSYLAADPAFRTLYDHPRLPDLLDYLELPGP